jgi:transcriptional regulator with XRE-family HTH domain
VSTAAFSARFRQARQRKKLTQAAVAEALEISQSAVAQWEAGASFPSTGTAAKIENLLGVKCSIAERGIQGHNRRPLGKRARLPIVGFPARGDEERILIIDNKPHGEIAAPPQLEAVPGAQAVYVRGRKMEPRYYAGEVVYLHPTRPPNPGDFVFVTVREPSFRTAIGYIRQYISDDLVHIFLRTLNPRREHIIAREDLVEMATIVGSGLF